MKDILSREGDHRVLIALPLFVWLLNVYVQMQHYAII